MLKISFEGLDLMSDRNVQKPNTGHLIPFEVKELFSITNSSPDAIIVINEDGKILYWNRKYAD